jgi:hypothetical protein
MIPSQILIICCRNFNKFCEKPNVVKKHSEGYSIILILIPSISSILRIAMKRILAHQGNQKQRKDIDRIRHDITKETKIRVKGRMASRQSKQSHSSGYE